MTTLFLDFCSHEKLVAIVAGRKVVSSKYLEDHTDEASVLPALETVVKEAGLTMEKIERIAATTGPGGFMSQRVGLSMANALSWSLKIPIAGIHLSDLYAARVSPHPPTPSPKGRRGTTIPKILGFARSMRKNPTRAESILWNALRQQKIGVKFRRQHPVRSRILDLYCDTAKLGIEIDGDSHRNSVQHTYDKDRSEALGEFGIRILRFTNEEVTEKLETVLQSIKYALSISPLPPGEGLGERDIFWIHSTKKELLFVRDLTKKQEPTLMTLKEVSTMSGMYVGEVLPEQAKALAMQPCKNMADLLVVLPAVIDGLSYSSQSLTPWYGRGA